jgi:hypothetical protein
VQGARRKTQKFLFAFALVLLLLTPVLAASAQSVYLERESLSLEAGTDFRPAQFEEMGPITIQDAADFVRYGFPGNGTGSNPYIIERLNITTLGEACIQIHNVNVSFVIRNCILDNQRASFHAVVELANVQNGTIEDNIIIAGVEGIRVSQSANLWILDNTICNSGSGLRLVSSLNITASGNSVYRHSLGVVLFNWNANLWSNYASPGPHNITGDSNSQDLFPVLLIDREGPIINSPNDIVMGEGSNVNVTWFPIDAFPYEFTIHENAVATGIGAWINNEFIVNLRNLEPGDYTLSISVEDGSGNTTDDIVEVSVLFVILGDIGTELVAYASVLSIVLFLVVLCLLKRRK